MGDNRQSELKQDNSKKRLPFSQKLSNQPTNESDVFDPNATSAFIPSVDLNDRRPETRAMRQNAILRMQQTHGNTAVQRS